MASIYRYRCRACAEDIVALNRYCEKCGHTTAVFERSVDDGRVRLSCSGCLAALPSQTLPTVCNAGHRGDYGWWNPQSNDWVPSDAAAAMDMLGDVWVSGDFEGVYSGTLEGALIVASKEDERHYRISSFQDAKLSNVIMEKGPPIWVGDDRRPPICVEEVKPVVVQIEGGADEDPEKFVATLEDFRLYDWRELNAGEIPSFLGKMSAGWIRGRAYARLHQYEEHAKPRRRQTFNHIDPEKQHGSADAVMGGEFFTLKQEVDAKQAQEVDVYGQEAYRYLQVDRSGQSVAEDDVNGSGQSHHGAGQVPPVPEDPVSFMPYEPCFSCSIILRLVLSGLVWHFCNWKHALVFFGVASLTCILSEFVSSANLTVRSRFNRNLLLAGIALLALAGILVEAYSLAFSDDCALISDWPIYLIGAALVLTALLHLCWLQLLMLALWFATTVIWCGANSLQCDKDNNKKRIEVVVNEIDVNLDYVIHPDSDTDVVNDNTNDPTNPDNKRKISIDDVTNDPDLLDKCGNSIYFSEVALFQVKEYEIEPRARVQLRKLANVLKKKKDRKIIITGHADKSGDDSDQGYLENIDLSNARAKAVADWLVQNAALDESLIEVRGAGTSMPITTDPKSAHLNRRVEVSLECPTDKKAPADR
jgi:outer membrane protein OmpA-like peptidoglycan-associated protein